MFIFTVDELIAWFETHFSCVVGWPMSRTSEGTAPTLEEMNNGARGAVEYAVFALRGEDTERDRRLLPNAIAIVFDRKLRRFPEILGTRLYWRHEKKIMMDSFDGGSRIYVRIAIPTLAGRYEGLPIVKEGCEIPSIYVDA
jgi:hypothetical protein